MLLRPANRIGFKNQGGLFGGGVCWWHSRIQRSATYLASFDPSLPRPTSAQAKSLVRSLRAMNEIVTTPGYHDLKMFSLNHQKEIQSVLNDWQRDDGFLNFQWIRGISGKSSLSPEKMELRMEKLYNAFKRTPIPLWFMAQVKGITSHAFLLLDMRPTADGHYLEVVDSNYPTKTLIINYRFGDRSLKPSRGKFTFVPYSGFQQDVRKITETLRAHCFESNHLWSLDGLPRGEIEVDQWQF